MQQLAVSGSVEQSAFQQRMLDTSGLITTHVGILKGPHIFLDDIAMTPPTVSMQAASAKTLFPTLSEKLREREAAKPEPLATNERKAAESSMCRHIFC